MLYNARGQDNRFRIVNQEMAAFDRSFCHLRWQSGSFDYFTKIFLLLSFACERRDSKSKTRYKKENKGRKNDREDVECRWTNTLAWRTSFHKRMIGVLVSMPDGVEVPLFVVLLLQIGLFYLLSLLGLFWLLSISSSFNDLPSYALLLFYFFLKIF